MRFATGRPMGELAVCGAMAFTLFDCSIRQPTQQQLDVAFQEANARAAATAPLPPALHPAAPPRVHRARIALALRRAVDVLTSIENAVRTHRAQPG